MKGLRLLNNGQWNKPPVLLAARRILIAGLAKQSPLGALGDAADFLNGTSYDTEKVSELGIYPIIRISNITDPTSPYLRTAEELPARYRITQGDLLVSWSASFKSILWTGPDGYLNQHIFKVSERPGFVRSFIRHAIEASFEEMRENVVGIGMMHLRRADFLGYQIPCPPIVVQQAVARYLDWLEGGCQGDEPHLPETLAEQRRIVAHIEALAAKIAEARSLRQQAAEEAEALLRSILTHDEQAKLTPMRELVRLRPPDVTVRADESYQFAGVYCFGRGVFKAARKSGMDFAYPRLTRLRAGEFVYPKLMAWEGALGIVPPECDGCVVSTEFPVFEVLEDRVVPEVLDTYFRTPSVWPELSSASTGTNVRRRRLNPQDFLSYEMPLPSWKTQMTFRKIRAEMDTLKHLQAETATELDAMLPGILDRAFKGELL